MEVRDVLRYRKRAIPSANMITNVAAPDHLDKFLCHVQCVCVCFFFERPTKERSRLQASHNVHFAKGTEKPFLGSIYQSFIYLFILFMTSASHILGSEYFTYIALSFDEINFFNMAHLHLDFTFNEKPFILWRLSNDCQIACFTLVSGPPNKKPYNKHVISLFNSVRTVNYEFTLRTQKTRLIRGRCIHSS